MIPKNREQQRRGAQETIEVTEATETLGGWRQGGEDEDGDGEFGKLLHFYICCTCINLPTYLSHAQAVKES